MRIRSGVFVVAAFVLAMMGQGARQPAAIVVDYPAEGSVFPPEFPPPLVLWRDGGSRATSWTVEAIFADGGPPIRVEARGERMRVGPIDARCVSPTNEPPKLTAEQAAARTWRPRDVARSSADGAQLLCGSPGTWRVVRGGRCRADR